MDTLVLGLVALSAAGFLALVPGTARPVNRLVRCQNLIWPSSWANLDSVHAPVVDVGWKREAYETHLGTAVCLWDAGRARGGAGR